MVCAVAVTSTTMFVAWSVGRLHRDGARNLCLLWTQRLAERLTTLRPSPALRGATESLRMQAEYYAYHLEDDRRGSRHWTSLRKQVRQTYEDAVAVAAGQDPFTLREGVCLRGFRSPADGTLQPYSISVPKGYSPSRPAPMLVHLHGHGWYARFQGHPAPLLPGALALSPHGRGSMDYMRLGETDVLMAIADARQHYAVDPNRVYVSGASMGGTGSWQLAVRYPDQFAGIGPTNGNADHRVWEAQWGWSSRTSGSFAKLKRYVADTISPITFAENLLNVPAFCIHGEIDEVVPVQHSRNMVARAKAAGGDVVYQEIPDAMHGYVPGDLALKQLVWLAQRPRDPRPKRVRFKAHRRRYPGAYWVRVRDLRHELECATVDAQVVAPSEIVVKTSNVLALGSSLQTRLWPQGKTSA